MIKSKLNDFINEFLKGDRHTFELIDETVSDFTFNNLDLKYSVMSKCLIQDCVFNNVDFYNSQLSRTEFRNCIFNNCNLSEAAIYQTVFNNCILVETTLIKLDALETRFEKTDFITCDFKLFDLGSAIIKECKAIDPKNLNANASLLQSLVITESQIRFGKDRLEKS